MKQQHIYLFFISLLLFAGTYAQQTSDSLHIKENYGLRVGIDISKPIGTFFDAENKGFEVQGDFRITSNYYIAAELGTSDKTSSEDYMNFTTSGSYIKVGFNYNAYKNWQGMNNEIFVGFRYGMSLFNQTLNSYTPNVYGTYITPTLVEPNTEFKSLNASWLEFIFGMKVETFKNLYLGTSISFNKMINSKEPENFKNLFVPGFNRVFSNNAGVSFNYSISYLIPIFKKIK